MTSSTPISPSGQGLSGTQKTVDYPLARAPRGTGRLEGNPRALAPAQCHFSLRDAMRIRVCSQCQAEYVPNNGKQRFCSDRCRRDFQSARRKEERWAERERQRERERAELRALRASWSQER